MKYPTNVSYDTNKNSLKPGKTVSYNICKNEGKRKAENLPPDHPSFQNMTYLMSEVET